MPDRPVIICTERRGVFFGRTAKPTDDILRDKVVELTGARMAIYFGTTRGVMQLAEAGPTEKSKVGAPANIGLNAVTAVFECTAQAAKRWEAA